MQYIALVVENIAIYYIGVEEYCNILYWCLRIVQYNNNSIVPSPGGNTEHGHVSLDYDSTFDR